MRLVRSLTAITAALAAAAICITAAQASPAPAQRGVTGSHGAPAVTMPAEIVPNTVRAHAQSRVATAAGQTSFNWSGYVASGGSYTSVTSNWIEPQVWCTSKGIVSFWIGLDGWQDQTVEQDGTGVDCRTGSPQYYAWWETFPTNSQQTYTDVTVAPGDAISSTVSYADGQYTLVLADTTQNWTKSTVAPAPTGATNASAEVVAEAASLNGTVTQPPDFGDASFTGSSIDGDSLGTAGAVATDMVNAGGSVIASTAEEDDTTGNFDVTFTGGVSNVQAAFQSDAGVLHTYDVSGDANQKQALLAGTSPSIAAVPGGYETAFQGSTGHLTVFGTGGKLVDTGLGMLAGTSPGITALPGGGFEVAFQANTGLLWTYSSSSGAVNLGFGLFAGSSPSIAALATGGVQIAFEANTGSLWTYSSTSGSGGSLRLGMMTGTSPSITAMSKSGYMIAFQANSGLLWTFSSPGGATNQSLGMAAGTSPNIAAASGGGYGVTFQANTQTLWTFVSSVGASDQKLVMAAGTSPAIVAVPGGYETAVQADSGDFVVSGTAGNVDTRQTMMKGTSPDIAP